MKKFIIPLVLLTSCIGEDFVMDEVQPEVRITNPIINMQINTEFQFEFAFLDNVGMVATPDEIIWATSDASIAIIDQEGKAMALDYGEVTFTMNATLGDLQADTTITFEVSDNPTTFVDGSRDGSLQTTTSYVLEGDFDIEVDNNELVITFENNYIADDGLPGLYIYLTNNPNSPSEGYEIGAVQVFSGRHTYRVADIGLYDYDYLFYYCKPFKVKVGHGKID